MRIHLLAFAGSFTAVCSIIVLAISVWARLSSSFGGEFMAAFQSVHPNPFGATDGDLSAGENALGALFDFFYVATDSLIFSLAFGSLYNFLATRGQRQPD